jgi:hypothetical protein
MKKTLLIAILLFCSFQAQSQFMQILSTQATTVPNGINVNVQTGTGHGAGFMNNSYTIVGNVIELNVSYWFNDTLPILYFTHDFFIPVSAVGTYTINIHIMMSQSTEICDNFANPANTTLLYGFMSNQKYPDADAVKLYPNPSSGMIYFDGLDAKVNRVEVFDISGKSVKVHENFAGNSLDLSDLRDGFYFLKIETEKGFVNRKIVLKK